MKNTFLIAAALLAQVAQTAVAKTPVKQAPTPSKYFIVQNIATEKMRVYEKCTETPSCPHRMIYETDMVAGKIDGGEELRTRVGTYKIQKWVKFYEDGAGAYPSWFDPSFPATPGPGNGFTAWTSQSAMPNKAGSMRGAFGWYAAMVYPNSNSQWMHGTIGWGSDGDKFIKQTRGFFANLFADPRSHGCTRVENRAIAYIQSFITPGTDLYRVYAKEAFADVTLARYSGQGTPVQFDYILTKDQVRMSGPNSSSAPAVKQRLSSNIISSADILEEGSYRASQYPTGQPLTSKRASSGKSGDTYSKGRNSFKGVFLVDEGRFVNYDHPAGMPRGGITGSTAVLASYAIADVAYTLAGSEKAAPVVKASSSETSSESTSSSENSNSSDSSSDNSSEHKYGAGIIPGH